MYCRLSTRLTPRVLRFRTFSKAYGLAGIRIGYVIGERGLIGEFNKVRNHFGVGRVAQAAALAALSDTCIFAESHYAGRRTDVIELQALLLTMGWPPSHRRRTLLRSIAAKMAHMRQRS